MSNLDLGTGWGAGPTAMDFTSMPEELKEMMQEQILDSMPLQKAMVKAGDRDVHWWTTHTDACWNVPPKDKVWLGPDGRRYRGDCWKWGCKKFPYFKKRRGVLK